MKPFLAVSVFLGSFIYRFYIKYWGLYMQPLLFCVCTEDFTHGNADFQVLWSHFLRLVTAALVHPCVHTAGMWYLDSSLPCAEAPGWSTVLELGSAFGHQVVQAQNHTALQDLGQDSSSHYQQPPSVSLRPGERQPPRVSLNHPAAAAASQLYLEKRCSCYRCGRLYTPQKLALTCQIARNLLWWLIILSLQGGSLILCK